MTRRERRKPIQVLWVFCEGKTEKTYFEKLRVKERISRLKIKPRVSSYTNAVGLVRSAITLARNDKDFEEGDLIACIFDRDENTDANLADAEKLARDNGLIISFSNPCFEYWILCHYECFQSACEKSDIIPKLRNQISGYKTFDEELYNKTKESLDVAKKNAAIVKKHHLDQGVELIRRNANPLTLVFELIQKIDEFR